MPQQPPIEEFDIEEFEAPPERSLLGKGWDMISSPLWEGPSRGARQLSGWMADEGRKRDAELLGHMEGDGSWMDTFRKLQAQGRGFAEGGVEGIGDLLSSFTSPIDLTAMALSGGSSAAGRAGFKGAARGLSAASRAASAPVAVHGATEVLGPDKSLGERARGLLEVAGGAAGMAHAPTPRGRVNPALAESVIAEPRPTAVRPTGPRPPMATSRSVGDIELPPGLAALADELNSGPAPAPIRPDPEYGMGPMELPPAREWKPPSAQAMSSRSGPSIALLEPEGIQNNASGQTGISTEAVNRRNAMKDAGEAYVVYDRAGRMRNLTDSLGPDAVDYVARPGETFGVQTSKGFQVRDDRGGRAPRGGEPTGNPKDSLETPTLDSPTVYHGTTSPPFDYFDPSQRSIYSAQFRDMTHFAEDPEYANIISSGDMSNPNRNPRTIPARIRASNVLDLTKKSVTPEQFAILKEHIPEMKDVIDINDLDVETLSTMLKKDSKLTSKLPFDAYRYIERTGEPNEAPIYNWAVPKNTKIETPWGTPLSKSAAETHIPESDLQLDFEYAEMDRIAREARQYGRPPVNIASAKYDKVTKEIEEIYKSNSYDPRVIKEQEERLSKLFKEQTELGKQLDIPESDFAKSDRVRREKLETPSQMKSRLQAEGKNPPVLEEEVGISRPTAKQARLQADLAGAKPRFAIGADQYTPHFESDIDKALFIIAQMKPSKRDADYLNFAMRQLGINEGQARQLGSKLRTEIKNIVKEVGGGGDIDIPTLHQDLLKGGRTPELSEPIPGMGGNVPPKPPNRGGDGGGNLPPDEPEMTFSDDHIGDIQNAKKSAIVEAFNLPRGLMASYDFSAPLRQGIGLIHKKEFWKALAPMMKSWASEEAFQASQKAIAERPLFKPRVGPGGKVLKSFAEDAGLKLGDLTDLSKREEAIMSTWAETGGGLPGYQQTIGRGVRMSNRAYTAFLNNLRADTFESLVNTSKVFGADARADLPLARALADFVNTASGRGSLGQLENSAVALNTALFSPRLIASRIQMMNPANYLMSPPAVRKEYLKSLLAIAAVGNTITQLGRMAGGTVESDPASSDFGKLKIGNTRIDPWAGFQQYGVLFNRLLTGRYKSSNSGKETDLYNPKGPYDQTALGTFGRFAWGKTHPVVNFAIALANGGKELSGEKMSFTTMNPMQNAITQRFIPIILQDMYELSQEEPELLPVMIPAAFGMGTQTYGKQ